LSRPLTIVIALLLLALLAAGFIPTLPSTTQPLPTPTPTIHNPQSAIRNKVGLHTRLADEPDPDKIRREFRLLREMGATWATEFFPWLYIQAHDRHRFDWAHADLVVDAAVAEGIELIARLDGVPAWARPPGTTWKYLDPEHYDAYADFVYAFVERYQGRVHYYIIWNEPNTAAEWGSRKPDPAAYAELLKRAYTRAKDADPSATIVLAGMAPNLEGENSNLALNDLVYLDRLYDAGAAPYFDGVAVHSYGLQSPPDALSAPDRLNFARAEQTYKVMARRGDASKPVFITEGGWNDSPRWSYAVRPYQRVEYTVGAYRLAETWPWCKGVTLWMSRLSTPANTYFDNYTFLTPDFIPKAIYLEVQQYAFADGGR
jgi:polysaccharide biosynthesis protein PslG